MIKVTDLTNLIYSATDHRRQRARDALALAGGGQ
jgi:hypothetical protein